MNNLLVMDTLKANQEDITETKENLTETKENLAETNNKVISVRNDFYNCFKNPFKGKWISIVGGSESAFTGWRRPYNINEDYPLGDVDNVNKLWWHILLTKLGAKLCRCEAVSSCKVSNVNIENERRFYSRVVNCGIKKGEQYKNLDGEIITATEKNRARYNFNVYRK